MNIRVGMLAIGTTAIGSVKRRFIPASATHQGPVAARQHDRDGAREGSAGSGYIPTEEAFNRYTFQVLGSRLKPGCAEDGIVNAALELLSEATR